MASSSVDRVREVVGALFGPPAERSFAVHYWNGTEDPPGIPSDSPFSLHVRREGALRRMLLPPSELSIAEAFIAGDVDLGGNSESAMHLGDVIGSRIQSLSGLRRMMPLLLALPRDGDDARDSLEDVQFKPATKGPARPRGGADAIQHHYDVGNDFYRLWLDERMVYTCAFFSSDDELLEDAQLAKLDLICRKLRLEPGQRLLDIGCGWGALIMHAAANYGVDATGITLSAAQAELGRERIAAAGLVDRCRIELRDYRDLNAVDEYDRIASVGMMEHVGNDRLPGYFDAAYRALKPGGVFVNHTIVGDGRRTHESPLDRLKARLWKRDHFTHKYVFPDGLLVTLARVVDCAEAAGFEVRDVESLREHYTQTLRHWLGRLEANAAEASSMVGDRRYRTWRLYMLGAINGFRSGKTGIVQIILTRSDSRGTSGVPWRRNYMLESPDRFTPSSRQPNGEQP
ncbi:MAG: cyclopropane-fatty-acyl-phospholipid synthase family protein [Gemmatimonadaceae bacterium]